MIQRAYKFRLYPNKNQEILFSKTFGCCRFIYNQMLFDKKAYYDLYKKSLNVTPAMYKSKFDFLKEVDSLALCNVQLDLQKAYKNFFNRPEVGFPKFKSKKNHRQKYTTNNQSNNIRIENNRIKLPKVGLVKIKQHRQILGIIKSCTIERTPSNRYFISILVEENDPISLPKSDKVIGIDLGIKDYLTTSNGDKYANPKFYQKSLVRLELLQTRFARTKLDSHNHEKLRIKVARQLEKVSNQRTDFLHKLSKRLIDENQVVCLEDLDVKSMLHKSTHSLARNVSDVSWSNFVGYLTYKAKWYGRQIVKIDRYYPSSQICNVCEYKNANLKDLSIRQWQCPECGALHDRDHNAAINILHRGIKDITAGTAGFACGETPRSPEAEASG